MNNVIEYKDWLFVHVSLNLINVVRVEGNKLCYGAKRAGIFWRPLPPGSWQIIGKGDKLSESDWEGLLTKEERQNIVLNSFLLLKTFGMELENCLVLKKSKS